MDAGPSAEAESFQGAGRAAQGVQVAEVGGDGGGRRFDPGGSRGEDDRGAGQEQRVVARGDPQLGGQISFADLHPGDARRAREIGGGEDGLRSFQQGYESDRPRRIKVVEEMAEGGDLLRRSLGNDQATQRRRRRTAGGRRRAQRSGDRGPRVLQTRRPGVDAHVDRCGGRHRRQPGGHRVPGRCLLGCGNRVLQVDDERVGPAGQGGGQHLRLVAGHVQKGSHPMAAAPLSSARAITVRWMSLVPSPIIMSGASR